MWIYVFGSLVRGDWDADSDTDVLAIGSDKELKDLPERFLRYTLLDIENIFRKGDMFAHHLYRESKLVYSSNGIDILANLGRPNRYLTHKEDARQFFNIANDALLSLERNECTQIFDMGLLYMCLRDLAMILSYKEGDITFSKFAHFHAKIPLLLDKDKYLFLKKCRAAATRGQRIKEIVSLTFQDRKNIYDWLKLVEEAIDD